MVDFMNPSEDLLAGLEAGRNEIYPQLDEAIQRAEQAENKLASLEQLLIECDECKRFTHHIGTGEAVCPYCERDKLQAVVDKLPKTKDGVAVCDDMEVWHNLSMAKEPQSGTVRVRVNTANTIDGFGRELILVDYCYSTKAAAEEAKEGE